MKKQQLIKIIIVCILLLLSFYASQYKDKQTPQIPRTPQTKQVEKKDGIVSAFLSKTSDIQVKGKGTVVKLLADDLKGSKHQKFLVRYNQEQTLLISHNIDLAPRINTLKVGDTIEFYGEYVYNKKGGIIHWTHHDPGGRHPDGWLRHKNKLYQ